MRKSGTITRVENKRGVKYLADINMGRDRPRKRFATEREAKEWLAQKRRMLAQHGQSVELLDPVDQSVASDAIARAKAGGFSLADAVASYELTVSHSSETLADVVAAYKQEREDAGVSAGQLANYKKAFTPIRHLEQKAIGSITSDELNTVLARLRRRGWSPVTLKYWRRRLIALWTWAADRGHIALNGAGKHSAHLVTAVVPPTKPVEILAPDESATFLQTVAEVAPRMVPYYATLLFAGPRPSEGMRIEPAHIGASQIRLGVTKTRGRCRRVVTISDNLREWLKVGGPDAWPVDRWKLKYDRAKIIKALPFKLAPDVLRHSFITYHVARFQNVAATALEAGNTEQVIFDHYYEMVEKEVADQFWALAPPPALKKELARCA